MLRYLLLPNVDWQLYSCTGLDPSLASLNNSLPRWRTDGDNELVRSPVLIPDRDMLLLRTLGPWLRTKRAGWISDQVVAKVLATSASVFSSGWTVSTGRR